MQQEESIKLLNPYKGSSPYIFISYSHKNSDEVMKIISNLQYADYRVWYDGGIDPGAEWDENIASHVSECSYFIAFISNEYLASSNCKDELNYARDKEKPRLLVYLHDTQLPEGMSMRLNRLQAIHKYKYDNEDEFYEKLFLADGINICRSNSQEQIYDSSREYVTNKSAPTSSPASSVSGNKPFIIGVSAGGAVIIALIIAVISLASQNKNSEITADIPVIEESQTVSSAADTSLSSAAEETEPLTETTAETISVTAAETTAETSASTAAAAEVDLYYNWKATPDEIIAANSTAELIEDSYTSKGFRYLKYDNIPYGQYKCELALFFDDEYGLFEYRYILDEDVFNDFYELACDMFGEPNYINEEYNCEWYDDEDDSYLYISSYADENNNVTTHVGTYRMLYRSDSTQTEESADKAYMRNFKWGMTAAEAKSAEAAQPDNETYIDENTLYPYTSLTYKGISFVGYSVTMVINITDDHGLDGVNYYIPGDVYQKYYDYYCGVYGTPYSEASDGWIHAMWNDSYGNIVCIAANDYSEDQFTTQISYWKPTE